ncbi:MAG TPA: hypothetical protein PLN85_00990 [archaeon]|nr:hypothetical protein [archaeon]
MKKKNTKVQITEIFSAKTGNDWNRHFLGTLKKERDSNDNLINYGKIFVKYKKHDGFVLSMGKDEKELGNFLDEMVYWVLDKKLHKFKGVFFKKYGFEYHMN